MDLTDLTGSTAQSADTPTTPFRDGSIRAAFAVLVTAIVGAGCKALSLSDSETAQVLALVPATLLFVLGVFDRYVAPRLG